jgi:23S rRNA (adenine2503-C2)-methyltransferase
MSQTKKIFLFDLSLSELQKIIESLGEPVFRAKQIWVWMYVKCAGSFDEMTDLPKKLRDKLRQELIFSHLTPQIDLTSTDGYTRKILFNLHDKSQVETVLMGYNTRQTACISTQAGCGLGCTFCATGQAGLQRNISRGEIIEQVLYFERFLRNRNFTHSTHIIHSTHSKHSTHFLTNLVYMGMGEPFANYKEVMKSIEILTSPEGFNFGARRITISTVGLVPMIEKFADENNQINLAVSLHAATDELRETMLPINKKYPLKVLMPACKKYTQKTHRRISFEWALIDGVNDTPEQARMLGKLLKGMLSHVNLIPLNPTKGFNGHESNHQNITKFRTILDNYGIPNTLRVRRGIDIHAGCGQLRQTNAERSRSIHS